MRGWRRYLRYGLAAFVVSLGAAVLFGLRDRTDSSRAVVVERVDPDAVIQTRGSRILQADSVGENLRVVADRQLTYPDGTLRMIDGVTVTVAERENRPGFVLTANESSIDADQTTVELSGQVRFTSQDGLEATTEAASYFDGEGVIRMPDDATFTRYGMRAEGHGAEYDRSRDVLRLLESVRVVLATDVAGTRITSQSATLAQTEGFMRFEGGVEIDGGSRHMVADRARISFVDDASEPESLELLGSARVQGETAVAGQLREMSAETLTLTYDESGQRVERAVLIDDATLGLYGEPGTAGIQIGGRSIDVELAPDDGSVRSLTAHQNVFLDLPSSPGVPAQSVRASTLRVFGEGGEELDAATFEGNVEYRERRRQGGQDLTRVARANRLDATLTDGMSTLEQARFYGDVTFEDQSVAGDAAEAVYLLPNGVLELLTAGTSGRTPRVIDRRGSVQAQTIRVTLDGPRIDATGNVESVLSTNDSAVAERSAGENADGTGKRPRLLDADQAVLVTADHMFYDDETAMATYSGSAHLWQEAVEFHGNKIILDEATGNIRAQGNVRTRTVLRQINDATNLQEETVTIGRAEEMTYDDALRQATYTTDAQLIGPRGDVRGETIRVHLQEDSRTLDRIDASGTVRLETAKRVVSGATLLYYDADGRYEMTGKPVRIVEELEAGCRETIGRSLTFFITGDELSIDGQAETRTQTASGECLALKRE